MKAELLIEGYLIIVDIDSIPMNHGIDSEKWAYYIKEHACIFYDSKRGNAPVVIKTQSDADLIVKVIDVTTPEGKKEFEALPIYIAGIDPYNKDSDGNSRGETIY